VESTYNTQPLALVDRTSSIHMLKWGNNNGSKRTSDAPTPIAARQGLNFDFFISFFYTNFYGFYYLTASVGLQNANRF
jgi:hypothetical protein